MADRINGPSTIRIVLVQLGTYAALVLSYLGLWWVVNEAAEPWPKDAAAWRAYTPPPPNGGTRDGPSPALKAYRDKAVARLTTAGPGHIPIDQAMAEVLKQGLPVQSMVERAP